MRFLKYAVSAVLLGAFVTNTFADESVTKMSGGSIKTELGHGIVINKESSLAREWITIHDNSIPADISGTVGVKIIYESGARHSSGRYQYNAEYSFTAKEALSAIEVRFLTFDIWGDHSRNLSVTHVVDIAAGTTEKFGGKWNIYSENEVCQYYASIAYIAQVRTKSGRVIKANPKIVLEQARKFSKKFAEGDLEPKPEKK